jgi:hypothetical protein
MAAFGTNDSCPSCGARMAADQHYCLNCGHRRGEPRLPFMDAVVFMETMNAPGGTAGSPPPPPPAQSGGGSAGRWNANAALIAGVATLVLAIGVGFLIGRTGHENSNNQAQAPIKVIEVNGGGAAGGTGEAATTAGAAETATGGKTGNESKSGGNSKSKGASAKPSEIKEGSKQEEEEPQKKTEEVLHSKVKSVKPTAELGESCDKSVAGCSSNGKFEGNFFE